MEDSIYPKLKKNLDWNGIRALLIPLYETFIKHKDETTAMILTETSVGLGELLQWKDFSKAPKVPSDILLGVRNAELPNYYIQDYDWNGTLTKKVILERMNEALISMKKEVSR